MPHRRLPIGMQSFRRLRETDSYYVDKTCLIRDLIDQNDNVFLSPPPPVRQEPSAGHAEMLVRVQGGAVPGLDIYDHWDWSEPHPVVRLSFGGKYDEPGEIEGDAIEQLEAIERKHGLDPAPTSNTGPRRLRNILDRIHHSSGKPVVVLVDEYDKPILDVLEDPELATANRDYLRGFYGIIKDSAEHVRFTFRHGREHVLQGQPVFRPQQS